MSDLIERLRQAAWTNPHSAFGRRQSEAADRIEALEAENATLLSDCSRIDAQSAERQTRIAALEAALRRLGSNEAFSYARAVEPKRDDELILRIDFARRALEATDDRAK